MPISVALAVCLINDVPALANDDDEELMTRLLSSSRIGFNTSVTYEFHMIPDEVSNDGRKEFAVVTVPNVDDIDFRVLFYKDIAAIEMGRYRRWYLLSRNYCLTHRTNTWLPLHQILGFDLAYLEEI